MVNFIDFPPEIIYQVLLELHPADVARVSATCILLFNMVYGPSNEALWRNLYISMGLEDPRECLDHLGFPLKEVQDWRALVKRTVRAETVAKQPRVCKPEEMCTVWRTLLDLASQTVPPSSTLGDDLSWNLVWVASVLRGGALLEEKSWEPSLEERQLRAHFHTLFGLTVADFDPLRRVDTRCVVYELDRYRQDNSYGPFLSGRDEVDWEHLLAIQHVMSMHVVQRRRQEDLMKTLYISSPMSLPFCNSILPHGMKLDETVDWAGVEGRWQCSFCFCDHRDLIAYNTRTSITQSVHREVFEDPDFAEAFTVLEMHVKVKSIEHDDAHPARPIIHFVGGGSEAHADISGSVRVSAGGNIRWTFVSNEVWSSEGIQVGNVRSSYGVLGAWSSVHHDRIDPVGPFWLRKIFQN